MRLVTAKQDKCWMHLPAQGQWTKSSALMCSMRVSRWLCRPMIQTHIHACQHTYAPASSGTEGGRRLCRFLQAFLSGAMGHSNADSELSVSRRRPALERSSSPESMPGYPITWGPCATAVKSMGWITPSLGTVSRSFVKNMSASSLLHLRESTRVRQACN